MLAFIELSRHEKMTDQTEKFFKIYLKYVQKHYTNIEYATAKFKYGYYQYENKNYYKAE